MLENEFISRNSDSNQCILMYEKSIYLKSVHKYRYSVHFKNKATDEFLMYSLRMDIKLKRMFEKRDIIRKYPSSYFLSILFIYMHILYKHTQAHTHKF